MNQEVDNLHTTEDIKPNVTLHEVEECLSEAYGLKGGSPKGMHGYDDLNFHFVPKVSRNPFVKSLCPQGYVVKIMNSKDSMKDGFCEAQNKLMLFLREHDIPCPKPVKTVRGDYYFKGKFPKNCVDKQKVHTVRVFEYECGTVLKETRKTYSSFYRLGIFLAKLDEVLKEFSHSFYESHKSLWHLKSVVEVKLYSEVVESPRRRELVESVVEKFIRDADAKAETFEKGMIHGDFNENNVLMTRGKTGEWEVSAIIDFGDSHYSCYLYELAIAMCYMMFESKREGLDPVVGAGHLLAGYLSIRSKFLVDLSLLKTCICARFCQSLVLGLYSFKIQPQNKYVLDTQEMGWEILEELWQVPQEQLTKTWDSVIESYNVKRQSTNSS